MVFGVLHIKTTTTWKHRVNIKPNFSSKTNFRDIQNKNALLVYSFNLPCLALLSE